MWESNYYIKKEKDKQEERYYLSRVHILSYRTHHMRSGVFTGCGGNYYTRENGMIVGVELADRRL
jgi:hypothetical protein